MSNASTFSSDRPVAFTQEELDWLSWLDHLTALDLSTTDASTDTAVSSDAAPGMPPAEQAICAVATARFNGCFFCASVHARIASHLSGRPEDLQRLLDLGAAADLGARWNVIVEATAALSATPSLFGPEHVRALRSIDYDDAAIADLVDCVASCSEANRLTLSLGEPKSAQRGRGGHPPAPR
jgi:uncharacterized peroxidase-related enzyme